MSESRAPYNVPALAVTAPTADVTARFHVCFEDERIGTFDLSVAAAPLLTQMEAQVGAMTDADLQAIANLYLAAATEQAQRHYNETRLDEFMVGHRQRLAAVVAESKP